MSREKVNIQRFKEDGVICVKGLVPLNLIEKFKNEMELLLLNKHKIFENKSLSFRLTTDSINSIHGANNLTGYKFEDIFAKTKIQAIASELLNASAHCLASEIFFKPPLVGMGVLPHQDDEYYSLKDERGVNAIVSLDKATIENGTIYYYLGSHKLGVWKHRSVGMKNHFIDEENLKGLERFYQEMEPGDCIFHDALIVHGSEPNKSDMPRKTITKFFSPYKDGIDLGKVRLRVKTAFASLK